MNLTDPIENKKMPVSGDTRQALRLLERIQQHLQESEAAQLSPSVKEDLNTLISVLDSPVFNSILNIQDSLQELKRQLHKHPSILPVDFDISPTTGELVLSVPSDPPLQNSDSYEPSSDPEQNYEFDSHVPSGRIQISQDDINGENLELSTPTVAPPDYALSTITTDSYAEEFKRTIDQGAQGREIHTLQLFKPEGSSLGFSVVGLRSEQRGELGIFIQEIQPNGIAGRDGRLQEGDQILAIDGQPLDSNISHQQAISILQQARGLVELIVARGGIPTPDQPLTVSLERSPSAVSGSSKGSDMVLNTEWAQVEAIDLINDGSGLGFGIIGGRSTGVVVKTILPGGVADRDGRLQSGDHILQIGEVNLRGMGSEQVAMVLRQSGSHVRLIVARPVDQTSSECQALQTNAPIVPTRILADPEEVERHLAVFQQTQNGFPEPLPYKGPPDLDGNFIYRRELEGADEFYNASFSPSLLPSEDQVDAPKLEVGAEQQAGEELPEMETFEVELVKDQQGLGITIAGYVCEKEEISGIFVKSIAKGSAADMCGQIRVNDQIIEVDGRSLHGYTNHQAVEVLRNTGKLVKLRLARYLRGAKYQQLQQAIASGELSYAAPPVVQAQVHEPKSVHLTEATNKEVDVNDISLCIDDNYAGQLDPKGEAAIQAKWSKIMGPEFEIIVAQLSKFREGGGLGISLEGTVDVEDGKEVRPHHYIRSILADGPVGVNGRLHGGDELLEVNGKKLLGMNHHGVVATLKELPMHVRMVCARRLLPVEREVLPSSSGVDYSHPYSTLDYDLSTMPEFPDRGTLSGQFGGSLTSLTPVSERLVKAKSDGSLPVGTSASSSPPMEVALSKLKSRSLEPLTGLAMWSSEPQIIELIKGDRGLGFSILDYQDPMNPNETVIVIRSLVPGGVAQQDGRLIPGDRLLFVNDINLENASLDAAVQALKGAPKGVVRIGVAKPLPLPESSQSGQVLIENGRGTCDLSRKSSFDLPARLPSIGLDSDQPSSLPATLPCDVDTYLEVSPRNEEQIFEFPSEPTTLRKAIDKVPPSRDHIWNYNIAPFPVALERTVRLKKGGDALGLTVDVLDTISGVVVSSLQPGSAAEKDGRIEAGDFLLSINNNPLRNVREERVAEILLQAEKLNTDVIVKYIPAADAAVHHQSELMSLDRETEPETQQSLSFRTISVDENFDVPDMEPPDLPPPAPPSLPSEEETSDVKKEAQKVEQSPPPIKEKVVSHVLATVSIPKPTPPKSAVPSLEIKKAILPVRSPKPAVPLKPIRTSLSPLDIPSREKSRASTLEGIISEIGSSTLSRQWGPERNVELWRDSFKGLGISIISGKVDTFQAGIFIKNVLSDSPAGWNGTLKRGDRILEVGGVNLRNAAHSKAVEVIKNAQNPVKFVVQSLVPVPKKSDSEASSVEMKPPPVPQSPIPSEDQPAVPTQLQPPRPSLSEISSQIHIKVPSPVSWTPSLIPSQSPAASINEGIKKAASDEKEPPLPPPRTVSRILKTPSDTAADDDDEDDSETTDKVSSTLPQGKVLTKKGVEIDFASAGHVKLTPSEKAEDPEEEDDFGYTLKKIQKKYGDMKGELIVVDLVKGSNKLGLSLAGNKDRTKMSVFVCGMHPNGNAAKDGRIKIGDELLEVNGLVMYGRCHLNASAMIKGLSGTAYKILLLRREGAAEEMAVKPLSQFPSELDEETPEDKYCHYRGMRTVTVRKGAHGLGIMIIEGKHAEVGQGIFISDIQENSAAEQAGLTVGDMILSANETDLVGADYDTAASILKQAEGLITLIVANPNKPSPGFLYDEEMKSDEKIIDKSQERNMTLKTLDKKKEKSTPPLPPPKPLHLTGKPTTHITATAATSLLSALGRHSITPSLTSPQKMKLLPMPPIANIDDDVSSSQEQNEPPPDPKKCDIKPGRETTIEITKEKIGLGLSIVGGSDTPLGAIIIHEVYPDGAAALDARLKPGDQILEVNGEDLREAPHERAITALRQTPAVVLMLVYREESHNHEEDAHEVLEVELHKKPGRGLGLSIVGRKNGPGVFISEVVKGGVAEADGRLIQGDQILEVNGQDLKNATQEHAAAVLKTTMGRINMKIGRLKAGSRRSTSGLATTPRLEENMDTPPECKTITLERGTDGLGFSIVGGFGSPHGDLPIYVKKVFEKGAAAEDGGLQRGDQIIAVNEQSLQGLTHEEAVAILKKVTGTVTLTVLS